MARAVLDTTVLVSAFLRPSKGGASFDLLRLAGAGAFELCLSDDIVEEVADTLITHERIRRRYHYPDSAVFDYCRELTNVATIVSAVPELHIVRDPEDDKILACAVAAHAEYLVARDKDLLSIGSYEGITMLTPELFLAVLRHPPE